MICELEDKIFDILPHETEASALQVFRFQYDHNPVYNSYVTAIGVDPLQVSTISKIPFLPIRFFKDQEVYTTEFTAEMIFESSGTTAAIPSRHFVKKSRLYTQSFSRAFERFYGKPEEWCILGLLPSYLERKHSSLVLMVDDLIKQSGHSSGGFYLYNYEKLFEVLLKLEEKGEKALVIGVTFALMDFAERFSFPMKSTIIMETGGMKGRREEITREEVHRMLQTAWKLPEVHSEYGMTELLSQAYSKGKGIFHCPPWMKMLIREEDDPFVISSYGRGVINVIDLANLYSCSFIATDDLGVLHPDGSFEVTGRVDSSEARGCSLMLSGL